MRSPTLSPATPNASGLNQSGSIAPEGQTSTAPPSPVRPSSEKPIIHTTRRRMSASLQSSVAAMMEKRSLSDSSSDELNSQLEQGPKSKKFKAAGSEVGESPIEKLPSEILEEIIFQLPGESHLTTASGTLHHKAHEYSMMKKQAAKWVAMFEEIDKPGVNPWLVVSSQMRRVINQVVEEFLNAKRPLSGPILISFISKLAPKLDYLRHAPNALKLSDRLRANLSAINTEDVTERQQIAKGTLIFALGKLANLFISRTGRADEFGKIKNDANTVTYPAGQAIAARGLLEALAMPYQYAKSEEYLENLNDVVAFIRKLHDPAQKAQFAAPLSRHLDGTELMKRNPEAAVVLFHSVAEFAKGIMTPIETAQVVKNKICASLSTALNDLSLPNEFQMGFDSLVELASGITDSQYRAANVLRLAARGIGGNGGYLDFQGHGSLGFISLKTPPPLNGQDCVTAFDSLVELAKGITDFSVRADVADELEKVIPALPDGAEQANARALLQALRQP